MSKCLVTKLQGIVNDDSLKKLGEIIFTIPHVNDSNVGQTYGIELQGGDVDNPITYEILGGGYFSNTYNGASIGTKLEVTSTVYRFIPNPSEGQSYTLKVSYKYGLTKIPFMNSCDKNNMANPFRHIRISYSGELEDLNYLNNLVEFGTEAEVRGDISALKGKKLELLMLRGSEIYGSINDLDFSEMKEVSITNAPNITGDLSAINKTNAPNLSNLTNLKLNFAGTGVSGDISTLLLADAVTGISFENCPNVKGSLSTFRSNNPNCTSISYAGSGITVDL